MARASDLQVPRCVFADLCVLRTRAHCLCRQFNRLVAVPGSGLWDSNSSKTEALDILEPNACYYMPYWPAPADGRSSSSGSGSGSDAMQSHLVLAKVAGFANAVYGLDNLTLQVPALMTPPHHPGLLLAALPLSHVRRARYSPKPAWTDLWRDILRWLAPKDEANEEEGDAPAWTDSAPRAPRAPRAPGVGSVGVGVGGGVGGGVGVGGGGVGVGGGGGGGGGGELTTPCAVCVPL